MPHEHEQLNCREIFALLSEYLDAELPSSTCEEISAHIAACPPCVAFVESLKKSIALCHGRQLVDGPAPLPDDARNHLRAAWQRMLKKT
jgi:anti-sigma factor RsiW